MASPRSPDELALAVVDVGRHGPAMIARTTRFVRLAIGRRRVDAHDRRPIESIEVESARKLGLAPWMTPWNPPGQRLSCPSRWTPRQGASAAPAKRRVTVVTLDPRSELMTRASSEYLSFWSTTTAARSNGRSGSFEIECSLRRKTPRFGSPTRRAQLGRSGPVRRRRAVPVRCALR